MEGSISAWTYNHEIDSPGEYKARGENSGAAHLELGCLQTWAGYDSVRIIAQAIKEAGSTDPEKVRDAMKALKFTNVMGKQVSFDDHNQAGKFVVLQTVKDRKVGVADIVEVR